MLRIGAVAPDFELYSTPDQKLKLSDIRNKKIVLVFYPADWSPVCGDQLTLYNEMGKYFAQHNAQVIGISVDSKWSHLAFSESRHFHFPLLSDFEPKGEVARLYDVYDAEKGECQRTLYAIDEKRIICWNYLAPVGLNPGADGIFNALEDIDNLKTQNQ